jgi:hypothetical protein
MKKLLFSISFLCYFAVTSGIVVNSHYCMKQLVSVHLFEKKAKICGKCGMDQHESSGCCRDEVKLVKLEQDQNVHAFTLPGIAALSCQFIMPSEFIVLPFAQDTNERHFQNHSPPLLSEQGSYIENRVFRI